MEDSKKKKNPGGRPRKYKSVEQFDSAVDGFIEHCKVEGEPVTWTGLALHLGFCCRADIDNYAKYDGFSYSVKRAKMLVERAYEKRLCTRDVPPAGPIFVLKNMGWSDKQEIETEHKGQITINSMMPEPAPLPGDLERDAS